jgi:hypothetical protein
MTKTEKRKRSKREQINKVFVVSIKFIWKLIVVIAASD